MWRSSNPSGRVWPHTHLWIETIRSVELSFHPALYLLFSCPGFAIAIYLGRRRTDWQSLLCHRLQDQQDQKMQHSTCAKLPQVSAQHSVPQQPQHFHAGLHLHTGLLAGQVPVLLSCWPGGVAQHFVQRLQQVMHLPQCLSSHSTCMLGCTCTLASWLGRSCQGKHLTVLQQPQHFHAGLHLHTGLYLGWAGPALHCTWHRTVYPGSGYGPLRCVSGYGVLQYLGIRSVLRPGWLSSR